MPCVRFPSGLLSFQGEYGPQTELIMAATVMNIIPLIVLFIVMQKQLVSGIPARQASKADPLPLVLIGQVTGNAFL